MTVEIQNNKNIISEYQMVQDSKLNLNMTSSEISKTKPSMVEELESPYKMKEIKDEYIPSSEVSFEERLKQVISTEEMKQLLSLVIRQVTKESGKGQNIDVLG